jgi:hypothetical protein
MSVPPRPIPDRPETGARRGRLNALAVAAVLIVVAAVVVVLML